MLSPSGEDVNQTFDSSDDEGLLTHHANMSPRSAEQEAGQIEVSNNTGSVSPRN